jgi:predicted negative regulator of RcsB-dependent stress response
MRIDKNITNKEEAQWLMQWFKNYGQAILIAVIVGLGVGFGWRHWDSQTQEKNFAASDLFQQAQATDDAHSDASRAAKMALQKNYAHSMYAQLTLLDDAKQFANQGQYDLAMTALQRVIAQPKIPALGSLASLQLAQILLANKQPSKALDTLNAIIDPSFEGLVDNEKALAYALLNQPEQASAYLKKAIAILNASNVDTSLLRLNAGFQ